MLNGWQKPSTSYVPGKGQDKCLLFPSCITLTLIHYSSFWSFSLHIKKKYEKLWLQELFLDVTISAFTIYQ